MKLDWSLAGQRDNAGGACFTIALPPSPVNRLRIEFVVGDKSIVPFLDNRWWRFRLTSGPYCGFQQGVVLGRRQAEFHDVLAGSELGPVAAGWRQNSEALTYLLKPSA